jgi:hypothetical protein
MKLVRKLLWAKEWTPWALRHPTDTPALGCCSNHWSTVALTSSFGPNVRPFALSWEDIFAWCLPIQFLFLSCVLYIQPTWSSTLITVTKIYFVKTKIKDCLFYIMWCLVVDTESDIHLIGRWMNDLNSLMMSAFRLHSDLEISGCCIIEILHLTMPGGTEENHKRTSVRKTGVPPSPNRYV